MIQRREQAEESWSVERLLAWTEDYFRRLGLDSPRLDAELLLAEALGCTRVKLYTSYQMVVEPTERGVFKVLIERRSRREPVAYILGRREFHSLSFAVGPGVLVPRPETEHLVDASLAYLRKWRAQRPDEPLQILDLGTGSGNIAVTLAAEEPSARVDAVDISAEALALAARNAAAHQVQERVRFLQGDLFTPIAAGSRYALLVSNPPYISRGDVAGLMPEVRLHEPRVALLDTKSPGGDGLGFYRTIAGESHRFAGEGAGLVLEVGAGQAQAVGRILEEARWVVSETIRDLGGIPRVLVAHQRS